MKFIIMSICVLILPAISIIGEGKQMNSYYSDRVIPILNVDSINNFYNWKFEIEELEQNFHSIRKLVDSPDSTVYYLKDTSISRSGETRIDFADYMLKNLDKNKYKLGFFKNGYKILSETLIHKTDWDKHIIRIQAVDNNKKIVFSFEKYYLNGSKWRISYNVWRYRNITTRDGDEWNSQRDLVTWPEDSTESIFKYDSKSIELNENK